MGETINDQNTAITKELIDLGAEWAAAMVANDAKRIGSFMADEWVIVSERGVSTKQHFLSFVESGALTHSSFEMSGDARIKIYGDTAVLTCRVVNTANFGGQQFDADEWSSDVFVKRDGKWLCVLSHITPVDKNWEKEMSKKQ
jgi:ketosteroid isomerase-like protein